MTIFYAHTGGNINNSGSTDVNSPDVTLTLQGTITGLVIPVTITSGALTSVVTTPGNTQSTICFPDATNTTPSRKVFKITAVDNVSSPKTITVDVAPTGLTIGTSVGNIGGRIAWPSGGTAYHSPGMLRPGDILEYVNTPATRSTAYLTCAVAGDTTNGFITIRGQAGVRPVLETSQNAPVIANGNQANWKMQNLELKQTHVSAGNAMTIYINWEMENVKISDAAIAGISCGSSNVSIRNCEITGCGAEGILSAANSFGSFVGNYIHGNGTNGITMNGTAPAGVIMNNIIYGNGGRGIHVNAAPTLQTHLMVVCFNDIISNTDSGLEVSDPDFALQFFNNIFSENGAGAGQYNVEWVTGAAEYVSYHFNNVLFKTGGTNNYLNFTPNSTEFTTDPQLTNPAGGDFSIPSTSPAKGAGYPGTIQGVSSIGYPDIGAVQRQETGGGGGGGGMVLTRVQGGF